MHFNKDSLLVHYNNKRDNKLTQKEISMIFPKIELITSKLDFDDISIFELVDTLFTFKELNILDKINEETINLLSKVLGNEQGFFREDIPYFCKRMKHMLIPSSLNHCDDENNIVLFLIEFDIMINTIIVNFDQKDYFILNKYNNDLCEVLLRYKNLIEKYNDSVDKTLISDTIIINTTLSRLITMLYFGLKMYDYNYDLIDKVFDRIIKNYEGYLLDCYEYGIYQDVINRNYKDKQSSSLFNLENVLNEYLICKDMLDKEFNPPIILRKEGI